MKIMKLCLIKFVKIIIITIAKFVTFIHANALQNANFILANAAQFVFRNQIFRVKSTIKISAHAVNLNILRIQIIHANTALIMKLINTEYVKIYINL